MSEQETVRKDFSEWAVHAVYMSQEGVCVNKGADGKICGNTLANGFHRHHKDKNAANNSITNLELHCPSCHRATYTGAKKEQFDAHRQTEKDIFEKISKLVVSEGAEKVSGASMEKYLDGISLALRMSRNINGIDEDIEYPPPSIAILKKLVEQDAIKDAYLEGFKTAMGAMKFGEGNLVEAISKLTLEMNNLNRLGIKKN